MYVLRNDITVSLGRAADYEAWAKKYGDVLKAQKGFQARGVANSLGHPTQYTALTRWASREAGRTATRSPAVQAFLKDNPFEGMLTPSRPSEAYEVAAEFGAVAQAGYLVLAEWNIDSKPGNATAFESGRKEVLEQRQKQKGFVFGRLYRYLGNGTKFLVLSAYTNREDARAGLAMPESQQLARAYRASDFASAPPNVEAFEILQLVTP